MDNLKAFNTTEGSSDDINWTLIQVPEGSLVFVPKEIEALRKLGINLPTLLKSVQK